MTLPSGCGQGLTKLAPDTRRGSRLRRFLQGLLSFRPLWPRSMARIIIARSRSHTQIRGIFDKTPGVVDVDWYVEADHPKYRFVLDKEKAVTQRSHSRAGFEQPSHWPSQGWGRASFIRPQEKEDVDIDAPAASGERSSVEDLKQIKVIGQSQGI